MNLVAALFFAAMLASLGVALFALLRRGEHSRSLLRALTVRVSLSVAFFLLLMLAWASGLIEPHGLGVSRPPPHALQTQ
jgi:hypothetical protein